MKWRLPWILTRAGPSRKKPGHSRLMSLPAEAFAERWDMLVTAAALKALTHADRGKALAPNRIVKQLETEIETDREMVEPQHETQVPRSSPM